MTWSGRAAAGAWLVASVAVALVGRSVCVYDEFLQDDYMHLYRLASLDLPHFLVQTYLGHALITFNAAFAVMHAFFGLNATLYHLAGLGLHAVNASALYLVIRRYARPPVAAFCAGLWGIAPLHYGTLSWLSAMFSGGLITPFVLSAIMILARYFDLRREPPWWAAGVCIGLLLLSATSYGAGIGVAFVFPAVGGLLAPPESRPARTTWKLSPLVLVPAVYWIFSRFMDRAAGSAEEFFSLSGAVQLLCWFVSYGTGSLVAGPVFASGRGAGWPFTEVSADHILPVGYLLVVVLLGLLAWTFFRAADGARRRALFAFLLLYGISYGLIAAGRGSLTWVRDVFARSHYHYFPMAAGAAVLGIAMGGWDARLERRRWRVGLGALLAVYGAAMTFGAIRVAPDMPNSFMTAIRNHAKGVRAGFETQIERTRLGSTVFIENQEFVPTKLVKNVEGKSVLFPGYSAYFVMLYPENAVRGRRVRFVERDLDLFEKLCAASSPRVRELLVGQIDKELGAAIRRDPAFAGALRERLSRDPAATRALDAATQADPALAVIDDPMERAFAARLDEKTLPAIRSSVESARAAVLRAFLDAQIDAAPPGSFVFLDNREVPSTLAQVVGPFGLAMSFMKIYRENTVRGRRIHFVERNLDAATARWNEPNERVRDLIVTVMDDNLQTAFRRSPKAMEAMRSAIPKNPVLDAAVKRSIRESGSSTGDLAEDALTMHLDAAAIGALTSMFEKNPRILEALEQSQSGKQ